MRIYNSKRLIFKCKWSKKSVIFNHEEVCERESRMWYILLNVSFLLNVFRSVSPSECYCAAILMHFHLQWPIYCCSILSIVGFDFHILQWNEWNGLNWILFFSFIRDSSFKIKKMLNDITAKATCHYETHNDILIWTKKNVPVEKFDLTIVL